MMLNAWPNLLRTTTSLGHKMKLCCLWVFQGPEPCGNLRSSRKNDHLPDSVLTFSSGWSLGRESHKIFQGKNSFILRFLALFSMRTENPPLRKHWEWAIVPRPFHTQCLCITWLPQAKQSFCVYKLMQIDTERNWVLRFEVIRGESGIVESHISLSLGWGHITVMHTKVKKLYFVKISHYLI